VIAESSDDEDQCADKTSASVSAVIIIIVLSLALHVILCICFISSTVVVVNGMVNTAASKHFYLGIINCFFL